MESLKSGDVPALVTNMELMNILSKRLVKRKEEEEEATTLEDGSNIKCSTTNSQQNQGKLRHRDYIEESVYEYLAHSSCASADFKKMPEFVSKLRGAGMRKITKKTKEQQNAGKVLTHTFITQKIWGSSWENDIASLRVFMATLRKKLEKNGEQTQYIQTHIGVGYRMLKVE